MPAARWTGVVLGYIEQSLFWVFFRNVLSSWHSVWRADADALRRSVPGADPRPLTGAPTERMLAAFKHPLKATA